MTPLRTGTLLLLLLTALPATLPLAAQSIDLRVEATPATVEKYRRFIERSAPSEDAFIAMQRIAAIYLRQQRWADAAAVYRRFQRHFPRDGRVVKIIALLEGRTDSVVVANIGPAVNSALGESRPVPTSDGSMLYFSAQKRRNGLGGSDIYRAKMTAGVASRAESLGPAFNSPVNESPLSFSADGLRFYLFGNYAGSLGHGDIFRHQRDGGGWGERQQLDSGINTSHFDSDASETTDGSALFFVSDRPGGVGEYREKDRPFHGDIWGNTDIYVTVRRGDSWSEPINIGSRINTPYAERSPWLAPDGRTLYFSSDGHYGLGLLDVFAARRLREDSWTEWSEPVNLGRGINSADDDMDYRLTGNGQQAIFGSYNRPQGFGGGDIYTVERGVAVAPLAQPAGTVPVRLDGLNFDYDRADISPAGTAGIRTLAELLASRPGARVEILGHTDSIGGDLYNRRLSLRRARAVVDMLVSLGISRRRLAAVGHGRGRPLTTNLTEEGRALNRRVEFKIVERRVGELRR